MKNIFFVSILCVMWLFALITIEYNAFAYASVSEVQLKENYYNVSNYKKIRSILKEEIKNSSGIDRILLLDELSHLHTYYDTNYRQVVFLDKKIRIELNNSLSSNFNYTTRYFPTCLPKELTLSLIYDRLISRELFFKNLLLDASDSGGMLELSTFWKTVEQTFQADVNGVVSAENQILSALAASSSNKDMLTLIKKIGAYNDKILESKLNSFSKKQKIEFLLCQAYISSCEGKNKSSYKKYKKARSLILEWMEQRQKKQKNNRQRYAKLSKKLYEVQAIKNYAKAALLTVVACILPPIPIDYNSTSSILTASTYQLGGTLSFAAAAGYIGRDLDNILIENLAISDMLEDDSLALIYMRFFMPIQMILEIVPVVEHEYIKNKEYKGASHLLNIYFSYADALRSTISDTATRERFQRQMSQMYADAVLCDLHGKNTKSLFEVIEKYSSKTLFDLMVSEKFSSERSVSNSDSLSGGNADALVAERGGISKSTQQTPSKQDVEMITGLINAKTMRYEDAGKYLKKKKLSYAKILVEKKTLAVLKCEDGDFSLHTIAIHPGEADGFVRQFNRLLNSMATKQQLSQFIQHNRVGSFLADQLFGSRKKLLVVYDAFTSEFPVVALVKNNHYLIEERPVFHQVSLSMARHIARKKPGKVRSVHNSVSFGNPARKGKYRRLENLVYARKEAQYFSSALGGQLFIGRDATKEKLEHALATKDIIHIASHSAFSVKRPLSSVLIIPSAKGKGSSLSAGELYSVPMKCRTIILSSCESGAVKETKGNEINGFVRPLLAHSVKNILMARLAIGDESSYYFMRSVVDSYKKSKDMVLSFQSAIKKLIADGKFARPIFWSPFILFSAT